MVVHLDLVESRLVGKLDAELGEAGVDPAVAAVEVRVPDDAGVEDAGEGPADCDAAAAEGHGEGVQGVLRDGLGARAEVPGLAPVVLGEGVEEVWEDEDGVVVAEHEPPRRLVVVVVLVAGLEEELLGDARGGEAAPVGVGEAGRRFGRSGGGGSPGARRWWREGRRARAGGAGGA